MVVDAGKLDSVALGLRRRDGSMPKKAAEAYWATAITLSDYRKLYDPDTRMRIDESPDNPLPYHYALPEVLISEPISPDEVAWAASILIAKQSQENHLPAGV